MKYNKSILGLLITLVLVMGMMTYPVQADVTYTEVEGKVTIETDNIWIEITGENNVPAYFFRGQSDTNDTRHRAQFVELFEFDDTNNNSEYDENDIRIESTVVALASLDVALGAVAESSGASAGVSFNMSLTAAALVNLQFSEVTFENHVTEDNQTRLKFDVIIDNYSFSLQGNMLALAFKLSSSVSNSTQLESNNESTHVEFGQNAYLQSNSYANVGGNQVNVSMTVNETTEGEIMTYLAYPEFSGQLVHDPTLGVDDSGSGSNDDDTNGDSPDDTNTGVEGQISYLPVFGIMSLALLTFTRRKNTT